MDAFRDRVVLITGAASGIGRQFALRLAELGARVAALDRQADGLDSLAARLEGKPHACAITLVAHFRDAQEVSAHAQQEKAERVAEPDTVEVA
jgi:NADP-dependent 3-hydroxy acid dehydrogenase YdfG